MEVFLANEQELPIDEERLCDLARHTLEMEEADDDSELSILVVEPGHIRRLNKRFAGDNHSTDVLAFPMDDDEDGGYLVGDVVICPRVAHANAARTGRSPARELETVLVHGTLHLLGYDHQGRDDRHDMEQRLSEVLESFRARHVS